MFYCDPIKVPKKSKSPHFEKFYKCQKDKNGKCSQGQSFVYKFTLFQMILREWSKEFWSTRFRMMEEYL